MGDVFSKEVPSLLAEHFEQLHHESGISIEVIKERGYESLLGKKRLEDLGFSRAQRRTPGILIPIWGVDGQVIGHMYRPDQPRESGDKKVKYENPRGSAIRLDVPPRCRAQIGSPTVDIFFVEGIKKADALASHDACSVGLNGVWGFKGRNSFGGTTILADFDYLTLKDRQCYVVYDSDYATNPHVHQAQERLVEHLSQKGARVKVVYLPPKASGGKQGADDFLAAGHTLYELIALAREPEKAEVELGEYVVLTETGKTKLNLVKLTEDLLSEYHFATLRETDEVLVYVHNRWREGGEQFIKHQCQRRVGVKEVLTQYKVDEIIGHVKRTTYTTRQVFNREKWVANVQNGLLDLRTRQMRPHTPDFLSTIFFPVSYDPKADCPAIRQFFQEVLPADDIPTIEELFGYCLIPDYSFQKAFLFVGDGANGKSTLLRLLKAFIGRDNCANVPWHALELDRFAKSELEGKLVNYFADIPSRSLSQTGTFKMLTGGDPIGTEKKFKGYFSYENFARLIFSANRPPQVYGEDSFAFWRRWTIIHFPNEFTGARDDKRILSKLATPQELSGLLNLAMAGLDRLMNQQHFSNERPVDEVTEMYLRTSDPVYAFLQDCCEVEPNAWIEKDRLYQAYVKYSTTNNLPVKKPNAFARALQNQTSIKVHSTRPRVGDDRVTAWEGIKLKEGMD